MLDRFYSQVQYLALCIVVAGFLIVGAMDIYNSDDEEIIAAAPAKWPSNDGVNSMVELHKYASEQHMVIVGTVCLLTGQLFMGGINVIEEKLLKMNGG